MRQIQPQLFALTREMRGCSAALLSGVAVPSRVLQQINSSELVAAVEVQFDCEFSKE